ncbi:MAG: hypothetical protein WA782_06215 [Sulfitobacter sp.]
MSKLRIAGIIALGLAVLSGFAETMFYGDVDADNVLQESMFLPLSFILAAIGVVLIVVSLFRRG